MKRKRGREEEKERKDEKEKEKQAIFPCSCSFPSVLMLELILKYSDRFLHVINKWPLVSKTWAYEFQKLKMNLCRISRVSESDANFWHRPFIGEIKMDFPQVFSLGQVRKSKDLPILKEMDPKNLFSLDLSWGCDLHSYLMCVPFLKRLAISNIRSYTFSERRDLESLDHLRHLTLNFNEDCDVYPSLRSLGVSFGRLKTLKVNNPRHENLFLFSIAQTHYWSLESLEVNYSCSQLIMDWNEKLTQYPRFPVLRYLRIVLCTPCALSDMSNLRYNCPQLTHFYLTLKDDFAHNSLDTKRDSFPWILEIPPNLIHFALNFRSFACHAPRVRVQIIGNGPAPYSLKTNFFFSLQWLPPTIRVLSLDDICILEYLRDLENSEECQGIIHPLTELKLNLKSRHEIRRLTTFAKQFSQQWKQPKRIVIANLSSYKGYADKLLETHRNISIVHYPV